MGKEIPSLQVGSISAGGDDEDLLGKSQSWQR